MVYLARQFALDRMVAIKLLSADIAGDPEQRERFVGEARITATLAHPGIVRLLDHGAECGAPWIAYEYLPGRSLRAMLDAGQVTPALAVDAVRQVAAAVHAAHERGILHRDLKPDNVLEASPGQFKVTDFGIAKRGGAGAVQTRPGLVLGTPADLSPEQCEGKPAVPASDTYALGVMLFELLVGRPPFEGTSALEVLELHIRAAPRKRSEVVAQLPAELDHPVIKALAKAPEKRRW